MDVFSIASKNADEAGDGARAWFRIGVILAGFPLLHVHGLTRIDWVADFYAGDRGLWRPFWALAMASEWVVLAMVVASYRIPGRALSALGLPMAASGRQLAVAGGIIAAFTALAVLGAGGPQEFLARMPLGARMFVPPSDLMSRVLWLAMCVTASVVEETLWRGTLVREFAARLRSLPVAVVAAALLFAYFHGGLQQGPVLFLWRAAVALGFSWLYTTTGSLRWPILIHFLLDATALAAIQVD